VQQPAGTHIERFLRRNAFGVVWAVVPTASPAGLRWLNDRTRGRAVRLFVGRFAPDTTAGSSPSPSIDRERAAAFLERPDVHVASPLSGGRHGGSASVWAVVPERSLGRAAVLVGAGDLTEDSLRAPDAVYAEAASSEHRRLVSEVQAIHSSGRIVNEELVARLDPRRPGPSDDEATGESIPRTVTSRESPETTARTSTTPRERPLTPTTTGTEPIDAPVGDGTPTPTAAPRGHVHWPPEPKADEPARPDAPPADKRALEPPSATGSGRRRPWRRFVAIGSLVAAVATVPVLLVLLGLLAGNVLESTVDPFESAVDRFPEGCPYITAQGDSACPLLDSLDGLDTICDMLPMEARPLRLAGEHNPSYFSATIERSDLVCAWGRFGSEVAGVSIPTGDLRGLGHPLSDGDDIQTDDCLFAVSGPDGSPLLSDLDYSDRWENYPLIRLQPGDKILSLACDWVPAETARPAMPSGSDNGSYPLIVGVDLPAGQERFDCPFMLWESPQLPDGRNWDAALDPDSGLSRPSGTYSLFEGDVVWPDCDALESA